MYSAPPENLRLALPACLAVALLVACGGNKARTPQGDAEELYRRADKSLHSKNYATAIKGFEYLEAQYPFTDVTKQAQLDLIYAYYKNGDSESAIDAAEQFIRENPRHLRVDYAYYIKGLVYFDRDRGPLEKLFRVDLTKRPPSDTRKSFSSFDFLLRNFPTSPYAQDARKRMEFLRNRLASYENHVARYYIERGAYVAAANRARYVLENYAGAPSDREAMELMVEAYNKLGLSDLAADTRRVLAENYPDTSDLPQTAQR